MSAERETKTLTTPHGKVEVVINSYMTGGEMMDLEGVAVRAGVKSVDKAGEISMNAGDAYERRLRKLVDIMVVKVGEAEESQAKWNALRDLRGSDYTFIMKEVEAAASGIDDESGKA